MFRLLFTSRVTHLHARYIARDVIDGNVNIMLLFFTFSCHDKAQNINLY